MPVALVTPVAFRGTLNRIAPTQTTDVAVVVANLPSGAAVKVDIEGSGGANGTATIAAGASLGAIGVATVKGGTQTTPGNAGKLKVRAKVGGAVVGRSFGFTVAAYPTDYSDTFVADVDTAGAVGVRVQDGWKSDGSGAVAELDQVEISERVDIQTRDNPPYTSDSGTSATGGTSGYLPGTDLTKDTHTYGRANIDMTGVRAVVSTLVYGQLCIFKCKRTNVTDVLMPKSGYTITHVVVDMPALHGPIHRTVKRGAAVTVEGRTATAGSGVAESEIHTL